MRMDQLDNPDTDLHVLLAWLRNRGLDVELREHPAFSDPAVRALKSLILNSMSPHQLIVRGLFGIISVIRGSISFGDYEIYSMEGELFGGVRRYRHVEHAGKTIYGLLATGMFDESVPKVPCMWGDSDGGDGSVQDEID